MLVPHYQQLGGLDGEEDEGLRRYLALGLQREVDQAYKCRIRKPWYRPPIVPAPDIFFTYMSHRYPRLITNVAGVSFVDSMHGLRLHPNLPKDAKAALPLLADRAKLERQLAQGLWVGIAERVDEALLEGACGLPRADVEQLHESVQQLRGGRIRSGPTVAVE